MPLTKLSAPLVLPGRYINREITADDINNARAASRPDKATVDKSDTSIRLREWWQQVKDMFCGSKKAHALAELKQVECEDNLPINRCYCFINLFGLVADGDQLRFRAENDRENCDQVILSIEQTDIKFAVPRTVLRAMTGYCPTMDATLGQHLSNLVQGTAFDRAGTSRLADYLAAKRDITVEEVWPQMQNLFPEDDGLLAKVLLEVFLAPETSYTARQDCFNDLQNLARPNAAKYFVARSNDRHAPYSQESLLG